MTEAIRLAKTDDAEAILAIYTPIVTDTTISFELEPPTSDEMAKRITRILSADRPWLVCERGGPVVAYAYAAPYRERAAYAWSVESSINVTASARGAGLGTRLYATLMSVLAALGFRSVYAAIAQPNAASNALHARTGFEVVGTMQRAGFKDGAWRDVQWWQKLLDRTPAEPSPPRRPDAVIQEMRLHD